MADINHLLPPAIRPPGTDDPEVERFAREVIEWTSQVKVAYDQLVQRLIDAGSL